MDERHEIDPKTGFMVHKETGQPVGIFEAPPKEFHDDPDWPKWVTPHADQIVRTNDHVSVPAFPEFHVNRLDGSVTVLVANEDEEKAAMSAPAKTVDPNRYPLDAQGVQTPDWETPAQRAASNIDDRRTYPVETPGQRAAKTYPQGPQKPVQGDGRPARNYPVEG